MKLKYRYVVAGLLVILMSGCDSKIELFEQVGSVVPPAAIEAEAVTSQALPGQISLKWEAPKGDFSYLKIKYYDPLTQKDTYKIASKATTEMLIDNTRARYGKYKFYFQTFNAAHQGGEIKTIEATSGVAPSVTTVGKKTKISLTADQLSTNAQEPTEGPIKNILDGTASTFFHTRWSSPQIALPHYIQVNLKEPHKNFSLYYMNRNDTWTTSGRASTVELQISNDGQNWETVTTLSGLPSAASAEYNSTYVASDKTFTYFRFNVIATSGNTTYFNMAEFAMYDVELSVYDPEKDEAN
nr:discoidin domain-containing protein [uncultured Bacteroides sp.]